jgi:hypothetical protein
MDQISVRREKTVVVSRFSWDQSDRKTGEKERSTREKSLQV